MARPKKEVAAPVVKRGRGRPRRIYRSKRVVIHSMKELGALLRLMRTRLDLSQTEAAICCNVGRRFYVELENGKDSVRMDKVMAVLEALGLNLALGGPGTAFTVEQLAKAIVKPDSEDAPEHIWEAEFVPDLQAPYESGPRQAGRRGRSTGSVNHCRNCLSRVRDEHGMFYNYDGTRQAPEEPEEPEAPETQDAKEAEE